MGRQYQLTIEFCDEECFCRCNYNPPLPNFGGHHVRLGPGGTFGGYDYSKIRQLGPGTHSTQEFDERIKAAGVRPSDPRVNRIRQFRYAMFVGLSLIELLSYLEGCLDMGDDIAPFVPQYQRLALHEFINRQEPGVIPPDRLELYLKLVVKLS